jgi:hypothetical protein
VSPAARSPRPHRPTEIKVGYLPLTVRYFDDERWLAEGLPEDDSGQMAGPAAQISIRCSEGLHEIHVKELLVHELLHAAIYVAGLTVEAWPQHEDPEEVVVSRVSPILLGTLRDNPGLSAYLES